MIYKHWLVSLTVLLRLLLVAVCEVPWYKNVLNSHFLIGF